MQQTFKEIFSKEKLLNQPIDAKNLIRRVASMHLMLLGDLNRFKVKFLSQIVKTEEDSEAD